MKNWDIWEKLNNIKPGKILTLKFPEQGDIQEQKISFLISWVKETNNTIENEIDIYFPCEQITLSGFEKDYSIHRLITLDLTKKQVVLAAYEKSGSIYLDNGELMVSFISIE